MTEITDDWLLNRKNSFQVLYSYADGHNITLGDLAAALLQSRQDNAALTEKSMSQEFLSNAKDEIFELFTKVRDNFDGSEYQQGKKDGLRTAIALLGSPEMMCSNRGGALESTSLTNEQRTIAALTEKLRLAEEEICKLNGSVVQ